MTAFPESLVINMKRAVSLITVLCLLLTLLASCKEKSVRMEFSADGTLVSEDRAAYKYAPVGYEPTSQGKEYGYIDGTLSEKLYLIGELDGMDWLTTEYSGAATTVYYNASFELPDLKELDPKLCYICEQDENTYSLYTIGAPENKKVDEERAVISKAIEMLLSEDVESEVWPRGDGETYSLKLYSEEWPAIYYSLVYVRDGSNNYLYDRVEKRCINVGPLFEGFFEKK